MQNKGLIWTFIILLSLTCIYQLSFTWIAQGVESDAEKYANGSIELEEQYLDSMSNQVVYPIFGYTYNEVRKNEINLGLDLKGGMNVVLEVSIADVIKAVSSNSDDKDFHAAMELAKENQKTTQKDFVSLFADAWKEVAGDKPLTSVFFTLENKDKINRNSSNNDVIKFIRKEADAAFERTFQVLRTRVNLFGVAQPNIQMLTTTDRILVELPGVKNKSRVRQLLQGTAKLEFWETYENQEIYPYLAEANDKINAILKAKEKGISVEEQEESAALDSLSENINEVDEGLSKNEEVQGSASLEEVDEKSEESLAELDSINTEVDSLEVDEDKGLSLLEQISGKAETDTSSDSSIDNTDLSFDEFAENNPLFAVLSPAIYQTENGDYMPGEGPMVGYVAVKDTAKVNEYLAMPEVKKIFPSDLKLLWTAKPFDDNEEFIQLIAIQVNNRDGEAPLEGDVITDASQEFSQFGGRPEITMRMNSLGAKSWKSLTRDNIGKSIAIVLDEYVYSFPRVNGEIAGGVSSITGDFSIDEAKLIANILKAGKLPAPAHIVEEAVVGPSLGQEAINSGMSSFLIALVVVLLYIIFYYGNSGIAADIALLSNLFFILGILASTSIALTLPGIAGIVLTIGMAVDANVLIYERIREELRNGKGIRLAVKEGYKNAYSAIIDANVTTMLTGIILWIFGTGPIEGFAKVLVIGIITSLFTAIFVTRLVFEWRLDKKKKITVDTKFSKGLFENLDIKVVERRKIFYVISVIIIVLGIGSMIFRGFSYGVDFTGGTTYVVRFDETVPVSDVRDALGESFISEDGVKLTPEIKVFGAVNQLKITTSYLIDSFDKGTNELIEEKLNEGLATMDILYEIMSSQVVGPTIADDIKKSAYWAVGFSLLIMFLYIFFRFRKWQYGLGAVLAIMHDVIIVLSAYSIFYGIMPFSLDIDQSFIAAILTVVGYSINDTVVIFDRIREFLGSKRKRSYKQLVNEAVNSTLGRTINTSLTTIFVLTMIFIFGGEVIRGFAFALLIGVIAGTYSSVCVATPLVVDFSKNEVEELNKEKEKK